MMTKTTFSPRRFSHELERVLRRAVGRGGGSRAREETRERRVAPEPEAVKIAPSGFAALAIEDE